ncbi:MAG: hypothetical protein K2M73_08935 [Lachnospiraceae bacterium]|nr:hypothetical protein [Lachnospiraceae bacterium]
MGDSYAEVIIKKRISMMATFFRVFIVVATVIMTYVSIIQLQMYAVIIIALFIFLTYVVYKNTDLEYEYFFINGQLDVECIYGKKKRKPAKSFNFDKLEVMGPITHQKILAYEHRTDLKEFNYTSGYPGRNVYVAILVGQSGKLGRLYFEPSEKMVQTIYAHTPSRVFMQ